MGKRIRVVVLALAAAVALYALLGFLVVPYAAKRFMVSLVERNLGHRLSIGEVRFNPFTFRTEIAELDLREPGGGPMLAARSLLVDFEAASLWRRAWVFADIAAQAPHIQIELRPDGRHNFSALLEALHDPKPQPEKEAPPRFAIARIAIGDGRFDLADLQAGQSARLTLAPITFELTELTTEASDTAPYKLTARSPDQELIVWSGEVSVNPAASRGRLELQGWRVETLARLLGDRIALERAAGTLDVSFDYDSGFTGGNPAFKVSNLEARIANLTLVNRAAREPFARIESMQARGGSLDLAARKVALERMEIARVALALEVNADGTVNWSGAIPREAAATQAPGSSALPPSVQVEPPQPGADGPQPWSAQIGRVVLADAALSYADRRPETAAEIALDGVRFEASGDATHAAAATTLTLSAIKGAIAKVALGSGTQRLQAADAVLDAAGMTAKLGADGLALDANGIRAALANAALGQGDQDWQAGSLGAGVETLRVAAGGDGVRIEGTALALEASTIAARLAKDAQAAIELGSAAVRARTAALEPAAAGPAVRVEGAAGAIDALRVRDPASGNELARLARAELDGATAATGERMLTVDRIALADANADVILAAQDKSNWDGLLAAFGGEQSAPAAQAGPAAAPWTFVVKTMEANSLGARFTDQRQDPPLGVELQQVQVRAANASSDRKQSMRVQVSGRIKDSGQFSAAGRVNPHTHATDLKVKVTGLSLLPLQPYVARHARVQIVSAAASAEGRLRYGLPKAAGARLAFEGEVALDNVIVEETEPAQPLLAIGTARASDTRLTLEPNRLEIPDLRLAKVSTRLLIAEDQSVNIQKLLRAQPAQPGAAAKPAPDGAAAKAPAPGSDETSDDPFPVVISRVRVDDSVLEFADLSLTPQFRTRMHELQGVITGVGTSADSRARMELDARVDEFGSAQIRGSMNLFKPRAFTNVTLVFRNLEMTDLTPYAAKFAGYRIASGKLSLDLQYRIKNSALVGDNKIVIDKLELGERVESPTALDLPLELAIAILKDDQGRIDIGLPVSGSLEDPQFSIAAVVWRAIGNLLGRIVTAPFRAIAGMFGGAASADELNAIAFDPGAARLMPQERQKLETVAAALAQRPELKLTIRPTYTPAADREALQSAAVRREVLARAGIKLDPGEAPGPLDYGNARIRRAIEDIFTDAYGFPAARDLRASLQARRGKSEAAPDAKPAAAPGTKPDATAADTTAETAADTKPGGATPRTAQAGTDAEADAASQAGKAPEPSNVRVARAMARRLIESRTIDDAALAELARARGEAVAAALRGSAKVDPARIATAEPQAAKAEAERAVETLLELGVVK